MKNVKILRMKSLILEFYTNVCPTTSNFVGIGRRPSHVVFLGDKHCFATYFEILQANGKNNL